MTEPAPELKVWTDKRGRTRVSWPGRQGFPVTARKGESPQDAYVRAVAADTLKAAEPAAPVEPPPPAPAGEGTGPVPGGEPAAEQPPRRGSGRDPKPRTGRPPGKARPTTAELTRTLEELFSLPAIPFGMPVRDESQDVYVDSPVPGMPPMLASPGFRPRCEFCRDHFIQTGPPTAQELAKLSERSDPLRRFFEQIHMFWSNAGAVAVIANYVGKPLLHHLAPEQALNSLGPAIGVPPRPAPVEPDYHTHAAAAAPASAAASAA